MIPITINNAFADEHWKLVKSTLESRINHVLTEKTINKWKQKPTLSPELTQFLKELLSKNNLENFIKTPPSLIGDLIKNIESIIPNSINRTKTKSIDTNYLFLYSIFVDYGYKKLNNLNFINRLAIESCPYCNRAYIHTINNSGKIKPEIDHFYPKGIYPFLGASYFNLIPSCQTCNGFGGKGSEDTFLKNVVNPYLLKHDDFKFSYDIISLSLINPISSKGSIDVKLIEEKSENTQLFKLDELYKKHEDHVLELIYKSKIQYSDKYREYLTKFNGLHFSKSEIDRMIIGNYVELDELHKRPLSKLYRDIAIELGLIV